MTTLYIALPKPDGATIVVHKQAVAARENRSACGVTSDNFVRYAPLNQPRDERYCDRCFHGEQIAR